MVGFGLSYSDIAKKAEVVRHYDESETLLDDLDPGRDTSEFKV